MWSQRVGHDWVTFTSFLHTIKGFCIVNEAEVDIFVEFPCFFSDPTDVGNLISGSSASYKSNLNIWKFMLKPGLENFEHYFASMWDECNCVVVWIFFGIVFLWDWNENWPFPDLWPLLSFPNLLAYQVQHFVTISNQYGTGIIKIDNWLEYIVQKQTLAYIVQWNSASLPNVKRIIFSNNFVGQRGFEIGKGD